MSRVLAGIFVGGRSTRFGGRPKGLLPGLDGTPLVERLCRVLREAGADVVLVGAREAYAHALAHLELDGVDDEPAGIGPMGGLAALLRRAHGPALALACDLPAVSTSLVERLVRAPSAAVVAPRVDGRWQPLVARYDPALVLPVVDRLVASGRHALQALLDEAGAVALPVSAEEEHELRDWDRPEDVDSAVGSALRGS